MELTKRRHYIIWHDSEAHTSESLETALTLAFHWSKAGELVTLSSFVA